MGDIWRLCCLMTLQPAQGAEFQLCRDFSLALFPMLAAVAPIGPDEAKMQAGFVVSEVVDGWAGMGFVLLLVLEKPRNV